MRFLIYPDVTVITRLHFNISKCAVMLYNHKTNPIILILRYVDLGLGSALDVSFIYFFVDQLLECLVYHSIWRILKTTFVLFVQALWFTSIMCRCAFLRFFFLCGQCKLKALITVVHSVIKKNLIVQSFFLAKRCLSSDSFNFLFISLHNICFNNIKTILNSCTHFC